MHRTKTFPILLAALALLAGIPAAAGGGVWVSDDGARHEVHGAAFFQEGAEVFDLAELEDGETRVFGIGAKQVIVTREGDTVTLNREAGLATEAVSMSCSVDSDSCQIMTFEDDPEKVAIVVKKMRRCTNGAGDCDHDVLIDVEGHHPGMHGGKNARFISIAGVGGEALHGEQVFVHHKEGAVEHDLSELLDGETRVFGNSVKQVTAVREGDTIRLTIEEQEAGATKEFVCTAGRDVCTIMTFEDDPDKTMVMIQKTRICENGVGDCGQEHIELLHRATEDDVY